MQNLQESQGWATTEAVFEVLFGDFFYGFQPTGLRSLVCTCDGPTAGTVSLPGCLGCQWLYVLDGTMFLKAYLRGPKRKRKRWASRTGFARPHPSYVLDRKSLLAK